MRIPAVILAGALCLAGCGGMPSFPDPDPGRGQIVVDLRGEPREGVGGPATEEVVGDYTISRRSVEEGKAFERVDYDEIEDVVVICDDISQSPQDRPLMADLEVTDDGFSAAQLLLAENPPLPNMLSMRNGRESEVTLFAFSDTDEYFEVTLQPGEDRVLNFLAAGRYEIMCEQDEDLECTLYVVDVPFAWIGSSAEYPFIDWLDPGEYTLRIYPPRLPEVVKTVTVKPDERTVVTVELTVNDLPKAE